MKKDLAEMELVMSDEQVSSLLFLYYLCYYRVHMGHEKSGFLISAEEKKGNLNLSGFLMSGQEKVRIFDVWSVKSLVSLFD